MSGSSDVHPQIMAEAQRLLAAPVSRPMNVAGLNRDNARSRPVEPGMIARMAGTIREFMGTALPSAYGLPGSPQNAPFFPPGKPLTATAPGAVGRRFDYPSAINLNITPRTYEPIDFDTLRAMADPSFGGSDLVRLAIETRKDQMSQVEWSILPRKKANQTSRPKADDRCTKAEELMRHPDGTTPWQQWCSQLVEEHLVIDAPVIYRRKSVAGETIRLELMDGSKFLPLLNYDGRRPEDGPAYKQTLKGFPAVDYDKDELLYMPRNPRVNKIYGYSCVEQLIVTVNIALRRQAGQLSYFTDGTVPDTIFQLPPDWGMEQVAQYQAYWDTIVNDATTRRKARFVPAGATPVFTRPEGALVDAFDEWLARIVAYCFSLPPTPFVKMVNRATAESAYDTALSEGLQPLMIWLKGIVDYILANWMGWPDLEFIFDSIKKADPAEEETRDLAKVEQGVISRDVMRAKEGMEPLGIPEIVQGIGPLGFISIASMKKAIANGWDLTGIPQASPEMAGMLPGNVPGNVTTMPGAAEDGSDLFAGLPPEVLEALGLSPPGAPQAIAPRPAGGGNVVPFHQHPAVIAAFRKGDAAAKHYAGRMVAKR